MCTRWTFWAAAGPLLLVPFAGAACSPSGALLPQAQVTAYKIPTAKTGPGGLTPGPDGELWFTETLANRIAKVTTSGVFTEYAIPSPGSEPSDIAAGPDGNLWFTEELGNAIGKITTSGAITEYPIPTPNSRPLGITAGPDGNVWFTAVVLNFAAPSYIAKVTPSGSITEYPLGDWEDQGPAGLTTGPDGNLWIANQGSTHRGVDKVTPSGTISVYDIPSGVRRKPLADHELGRLHNPRYNQRGCHRICPTWFSSRSGDSWIRGRPNRIRARRKPLVHRGRGRDGRRPGRRARLRSGGQAGPTSMSAYVQQRPR